jgi:hypothetical protein
MWGSGVVHVNGLNNSFNGRLSSVSLYECPADGQRGSLRSENMGNCGREVKPAHQETTSSQTIPHTLSLHAPTNA